MATLGADHVGKTLHFLNRTGTISYNATLDTAIPAASIGLYQLINQTISELSSLKSKIKTNEKALIAESAESDGFAAAADSDLNFTNSTTISSASLQSTVTASKNRGGSTTAAEKPAMLITSAGVGYTEDALFELIREQCHDIMSLNNNVATVVGTHSALIGS
jgi:hypothetical protein